MRLGRGLRGGGHNWKKKLLIFYVAEHVDHFKAIKKIPLIKKWYGRGIPPPPQGSDVTLENALICEPFV